MGKLMQEFLLIAAYKKKLAKIENEIKLDMSKEVDLLMREGLNYQAALRQVEEMYKKSYSQPASKRNNDTKTIDCIISDNEDIDNNEIYDTENGQTIRDLI